MDSVSDAPGSRRRRRWPLFLVAFLVLAAGAGAAAWFTWFDEPGNVSNPDVEFTDTDEQQKPRRRARFEWPFYGFTPERTRYLQTDLDPPFDKTWRLRLGHLIEFQPVLAGGVLYVVPNDGVARAVDARTGRLRWSTRVGTLNASSPAYADGRLFIATLSGRITALEAKSGKQTWKRNLPSRSESSPLVIDGKLYFGSEDGTVYALKAKTGRILWTHRARGAVKAALAYSDGRLYFGDYGGRVTALRAKDGSELWEVGTSGRSLNRSGNFYSTPAVKFGRVYLGNTDGFVYSFAASSGKLAWRHSTGGYVYAAPAVARVPGTPPSVYIGSYDGNFYALDARSGDVRWKHDAGGRISGAPSIIGKVVYFSELQNKTTSGLDVRNGKRVFKLASGAFNPAISDGRRLYVTGYSSLFAFEPKRKRSRSRDRRERRR
jgi:outer membrane protein assembly factor BamB